MKRVRAFAAACAWCVLVCPAEGQTAVVTVSHNDPDGIVEPGQVVRISVELDWTGGIQFAGLAGSLGPTAIGTAGAPTTPLGANPSALVNPGVAVGGAIVGYDVASIPPFFTAGPNIVPGWAFPPIPILEYDWTAPALGVGLVEFAFVPAVLAPNVRLYPSLASPAFVEAQTSYIGTSVVVTPAAPSAALLAGAGLGLAYRGRRRGRG